MSKLNGARRTQIISALVEGNSLRATARMCDVAFNTVLKLLPETGRACADHQDRTLRNLKSKRIHQTLRVTPAMEAGISDHVWTIEEIAELAS